MDALAVLRRPAFRWLVTARSVGIVGNAVAPVGLAFAVLDLTGSPGDVGIVVAARSVANVAVLLLGGVIADRTPRRTVLVASSAAAAATQAAIAAILVTGSATILLLALLSIANGAVAAISLPTTAAMVPDIVSTALLRPANAMLRLRLNAATVLGASAGGSIIALLGAAWGITIAAGAFALSALLFARLRASRTGDGVGRLRSSVVRELAAGWREFASRRWVWSVVVQFAVVNAAFIGATTVLGPWVADNTFGRRWWGLVVASQTIGLIVGAVLAMVWRPRRSLTVAGWLVTATALPLAALALDMGLPALIAAFGLAGVALEFFSVAWDHALQTRIPRPVLARVYSCDMLGSFLALPIGEAAVGPLAQSLGASGTLLGCAAAILLATMTASGLARWPGGGRK